MIAKACYLPSNNYIRELGCLHLLYNDIALLTSITVSDVPCIIRIGTDLLLIVLSGLLSSNENPNIFVSISNYSYTFLSSLSSPIL